MPEAPEATQSSSKSSRTYSWAILFHYDANNEFPFSTVSLDHFKGTNFPFQLMTGHLSLEERLKPREFSRLPGTKYAIFAKVENGKKILIYNHIILVSNINFLGDDIFIYICSF